MKTEGASRRKLAGALIVIVALASAWALMHRQAQRAERELQNPLYQSMPILRACRLHLTHDVEHSLSEHFSVVVPFQQLDTRGQEAVLQAVRDDYAARLDTQKMTPAEKQRSLDRLLATVPGALVGFQTKAPGNAYLHIPLGAKQSYTIPLHMVPGTPDVKQADIEWPGEAGHEE
jgi:hypothetical protein